jgi:hypothetical protein
VGEEDVRSAGHRVSGEGTRLLADLTGHSADEMAADPRALLRGFLALGREAQGLVQGYASDDPEVQKAAEQRWAELAAKLPVESTEPRAHELSQADRERLNDLLRRLITTLEDMTGRTT